MMIPDKRFTGLVRLLGWSVSFLLSGILHAQTSPPTNSLQLWIRADTGVTTNADGLVEKWADQSGNANDAAQSDDT